jgi:transcription elongation GreA/GreB family factor
MSSHTFAELQRRAADLERRVIQLAPQAMNGTAEAEFFLAFRSLAAVRSVVERGRVAVSDGCAVVGSRVSFTDGEDAAASVELSAPGLADAAAGRISVESPLGGALLGRRTGDTVRFETPSGVRTVTVTGIA